MACVSAMRKAIGREAMEFAVELLHTSKAFHSMVCNRLEVICDEDLDTLAAPHVFPFVAAALAASREVLGAEVPCGLSLRCGHRGLRSLLEDYAPAIPDWANDQHHHRREKAGPWPAGWDRSRR
jgi:hypothetical protein